VIEQNRADRVGIEGEGKAHASPLEAEKLVKTSVGQPGYERDSIADALHAAHCLRLGSQRDPGNSLTAAREPSIVMSVKRDLCHGAPIRI